VDYILTCAIDGASRGNPGPAGAGVVVWDSRGRERRTVSAFLGRATNNAAEYRALLEALEAAESTCREDQVPQEKASLVIRTDSQLVARQVSGEYRMKSDDLRPLLEAFRRRARAFASVRVEHVPRERNRRADALANKAIDDAGTLEQRYSRLDHLRCSRCGETVDPDAVVGVCPACSGPLLAGYDLSGLEWPPPPGGWRTRTGEPGRPGPEASSLWRYHALLPVRSARFVVSLGEGLTPLLRLTSFERAAGPGGPRVWLKDEGRNPTGTFKARGATTAVSRLLELGVEHCAVPSAGNAASAFAAYAARAGLRFTAAMPEDTPEPIRSECASFGAEVHRVPGLLPDALRTGRLRPPSGQTLHRLHL